MSSEMMTLFDLVPGKRIADRYTVVEPSRQGGFSSAFRVTDDQSGKDVELTLFPSALFDDDSQAAEYAEGLERWKSVDSPYVVKAVDIVQSRGALALITELPSGESLRKCLSENEHLSPAQVQRVGTQLLEGLVAIHSAELVHGDIKPLTIHMSGSGDEIETQLVDGGVTPGLWNAKQLGDHTALIGTPFYAPVEQFGGDSPNVQSDIYNLATVLFELATGVLPWPGATFLEVFQAKLDKHAPSMSMRAPKVEVPEELERAIAGGLMADRRERYEAATNFRDALAGVSLD